MEEENISLEYLAGFFDAEGCISIPQRKGGLACGVNGTYPKIKVETEGRRELSLFKKRFGGNLSKGTRGLWVWTITNKDEILQFIKKIEPFLYLKKKQIKLMKEFLNLYTGIRGSKVDKKTAERRVELSNKISRLNKGKR